MLTNFHTHTKRCLHAYGTEEDYVLEAIDKGLSILGFSDHGPFPDYDFGYRMAYDELESYITELDRLSSLYGNRISIFKGLEIEYHPKYGDYYHSLISTGGLDYLALGEHMYTESSGEIKNIFFAESSADYISYAQAVSDALDTGCFRFVAHPDIMFLNSFAFDDNCEKACRIIIDAAKKNGSVLEFNANGLRREKRLYPDGLRHPYPYLHFWDMVKAEGLPVIVGSDCHSPDQVYDDAMKNACAIAEKKGLNIIDNIFEEEEG